MRGTHSLLSVEGGTPQDAKRNQKIKRHSLPIQQGERDRSSHRKKPTEQGALTSCRAQREQQVRIPKETKRARGTHVLSSAEEGLSQDAERNRASEGYPTHVLSSAEEWDK